MASAQNETTLAALRKDAGPCDLQALPDEELLDQFLGPDKTAAEDAFRELVRRHGPLVLEVGRHVLGQAQDAEDAFQATFLILARKAGRIRDRRALGRWLYRVAYRIAINSRTDSALRRQHERQGAEMSVVSPEHDPDWRELRTVLHKEVNRLPEYYRGAVVLCYLEALQRGGRRAAPPAGGHGEGSTGPGASAAPARLTRRGLTLDRA